MVEKVVTLRGSLRGRLQLCFASLACFLTRPNDVLSGRCRDDYKYFRAPRVDAMITQLAALRQEVEGGWCEGGSDFTATSRGDGHIKFKSFVIPSLSKYTTAIDHSAYPHATVMPTHPDLYTFPIDCVAYKNPLHCATVAIALPAENWSSSENQSGRQAT